MVQYFSSLSFAKKGHSNSLKTTVPKVIVDLLGVKAGDRIIWEYNQESKVVKIEKKIER